MHGRPDEEQVEREQRHAERAERHQPELEVLARDLLAQQHPSAMPMQNSARNSVTTWSSAESVPLAYVGSSVTSAEPKNQNHEMPSADRNTARVRAVMRKISSVGRNGFRLTRRSGATAGNTGKRKLAT